MHKVSRCNLKRLLVQRNMTQTELANRIGITVQQINKYALNQRLPSIEVTKSILVVLNCSFDELFDFTISRK